MKSEIDPMYELMKACHCLYLEVADSIAFDVQDKARAVKTELDSLRTQLKSVEADAAVIRQRLDLSIKCGKAALFRLNEAENLLRDTVTQPGNISQVKIPPLWISRRDAFLNPTTDKKG